MVASPITSLPEFQGQSQDRIDAGINIDKFATLFSPATPRASPTLEPIDMVSGSIAYSRPRSYHHDRRDTLGSDPEFGSFVSVPAAEDPLATLGFVLPLSTEVSSLSTQVNGAGHNRKNSSLRFFGKFAQEAKEAAERNKHSVLDELLLHEDDPLYWLKEQDHDLASGSNDPSRAPSEPPESEAGTLVQEQSRDGLEALTRFQFAAGPRSRLLLFQARV
jgi:hypothetical protein